MKLFIILSVVACSYAAKLDRTYLPPASAATAGGSPGSLTGPNGSPSAPAGSPGFGQSSSPAFGQPGSGAGQPGSGAGQPSGFGPSSASGGQPSAYNQPSGNGQAPSGSGYQAPSSQYGQPASGSPGGSGSPSFGGAPSGAGSAAQGYSQSAGYQGYQASQRAQASADANAEILRYDSQNDGETFSYSFETSNGIAAEESGVATNGVQAQGAFSYTDDDGQFIRVTYTADENGYQPQGDHLPTPPPIPDEILRSLEENAKAAAAGIQEGKAINIFLS
ncbi:hypothetical protein O3G_MSEX009509 [Manduca sexta]|uniref:Uncharacterized protein n=1 Tax=Manduca sexta TaxID=7130 RepID=A0A921ZEK2_MANSE|nr:hypothetical protein O3G_MSEX009509 [Manduca sexta]